MTLYKRENYSYVSGQMTHKGHEDVAVTLDDIKAYLAELEQPMVAVPVEPNGSMVKAALHTIPPEWGVCTGRQMMDIYEAMATAAGERE